ncbi:hypothetical protein DRE_05123 [Drechslerella stenobrocha 248]|uniref:Autophagy-related protein 2 n=1 Tax=Drechslerella stenobrocha 248 TaxID=1043628 RepID=W7HNX0_9PEZI|nr:hypothetical protein DRE_05123 [Drechslerella stenobrocha 248]
MLGYIPRSVQLKLFRYALSKLDFLDHSTYDVERDFNLSLGLKNELEMKNIGLNVEKLSSMLPLPPSIVINDAKVSLLHIRIPTDFHKAPVKVTISAVTIDAEILADTTTSPVDTTADSSPLSPEYATHDRETFKLPSGMDLTSSFLQDRPSEAQEVDAVLQSGLDDNPPDLEDEDLGDEYFDDPGVGTPLSFWNFVPSFFQRLVDRVEIDIKNVSLRLKVPDTSLQSSPSGILPEYITVEFNIESLEIEGVAHADGTDNSAASRHRSTKAGMRAIRLDGISISLIGLPEFFDGPVPFTMPNPGDTDTITSGSTILPHDNGGSRITETRPGPRFDSQQRSPQASTGESSASARTYHSRSSTAETITYSNSFFAQMEEPPHINEQPLPELPQPPLPPPSRASLASRHSSSQGSIRSDEINSELLSQSFLQPESEHGLSASDLCMDIMDDEAEMTYIDRQREFGLPLIDNRSEFPASDSDDDSLKDEPRDLDLFQEPNTKFLGVTNLVAPIERPTFSAYTPQPDMPHEYTQQRIVVPVPRPAHLALISQTLSNLEAMDARNESLLHTDEFTYYQESAADPNEYSNPDLLYLSQSVHSTGSSVPQSDDQHADNEHEVEQPFAETIQHQTAVTENSEPKVTYTDNDDTELSDSASVYQSYPASEQDDIPSFISEVQETSPIHIVASPGEHTAPAATDNAQPILPEPEEDTSSELSSSIAIAQPRRPDDHDHQKVPKDLASSLIQSQARLLPPPLFIPPANPSLHEVETTSQPQSATEETSSEGSDPALAESMLFTHEEAGSLYLSAMGGSQPLGNIPLDTNTENNRGFSVSSLSAELPKVTVKKSLLRINYVDIFIPGMAEAPSVPLATSVSESVYGQDSLAESVYPVVPGAFSVYAASRPRRKAPTDTSVPQTSRQKPKPSVSFQTHVDRPEKRPQPTQEKLQPSSTNRLDIEVGTIDISIDLAVGKKLIGVSTNTIELLQKGRQNTTASFDSASKTEDTTEPASPLLNISLASLNITLVDKMPGITLPTVQDTEAVGDSSPLHSFSQSDIRGFEPVNILTVSATRLAFKQNSSVDVKTGLSHSLTEITLRGGSVKVGHHEIIGLIPKQSTGRPKPGWNNNADPVLTLRISDSPEKRQIRVQTVALKFYFPTQDLEDMLSYFGGLESMLSIASSSNLSTKETSFSKSSIASQSSKNKDTAVVDKQTTLAIDIVGIAIELFVSDSIGGIGLSTSPIKIVSNKPNKLSVRVPSLAVFGPSVALSDATESASTMFVLKNINLGFDDSPTEGDLERLLTMITPSIDRYENDDEIMVDVLIRQRRRGSVVRVDIGDVSGHLNELHDIARFQAIAEELAKMATVAKYIPQDERPGMLTLVFVEHVAFRVFAGEEVQNFQFKLGAFEICHVAAPSLLALTMGQISLNRNGTEEWMGESLPRSLAISNEKDKNRPMVKLRMIGEELEPEIKIKIWNTRLEYHVKPVLALLSLTEKDTPDVIATNMVASIANLAEKEIEKRLTDSASTVRKVSTSSSAQALRLNLGLSDICIALNPLNSDAKALLVIQDGSFVCGLSQQHPFSASLNLQKANLVAIDDRHALVRPQKPSSDIKNQRHGSKEDMFRYTSQGYVSILTVTSAKVSLKLEEEDDGEDKNLSVSIEDVFIVIESCADSTQTIIGILTGLQPPLPESEEIKYMTQIMPVDVFANLDEDAFVPTGNNFLASQPRDLRSLEDMPEDLLEDEVPFNSQLIESFYPSAALPSTGPLPNAGALPPQSGLVGFHEQVRVVAEEPLMFDDGYFQAVSKEQTEKEPTIAKPRRAAIKASVRNIQLIWNLHDGYDWPKTRDTISKAVKNVEERASRRRRHSETFSRSEEPDEEEESETYDVLFNSIYITLPLNRDPKDLSKDIQNQIRGGYDTQSETGSYAPTTTTLDSEAPGSRGPQARRRDQKFQRSQRNTMQFELKGVDVDFTIFAPDGLEVQSSLDLRINDVRVTENVRTSTWRRFLTYMREAGTRERGLPMAHIHVDTLRPIPELAATELSIKVKLLPLRLYVDQDALEFLTRFFEFKDPEAVKPGVKAEEPFIQRCEIDTVRVKLDFKPKRVDYAGLRSGRTTEFMNFFILEEADMELRHVALNGVSGFERLGKDLNNIWTPDIKQNQLGGVLAGVAPFRSLVNLGTGVRDLVKVPIMEYRKDGRIVRSIKKGTQHFVKTSGSEVARLGAKLAIGTQNILEKTEELLVGEPSQRRSYAHHREPGSSDEEGEGSAAAFSPYANQPLGVYRGLVQAKQGFTRNLNEAKEAIMRVPSEAAQGGSAKSAVGAVMRAAPTAVIRPMIGVTEAVHLTLHGIDNTIDKGKRDKLDDKYKRN